MAGVTVVELAYRFRVNVLGLSNSVVKLLNRSLQQRENTVIKACIAHTPEKPATV